MELILLGMFFIILTIFIFTLPGLGILKIIRLNFPDFLEKYTIATTLGIVFFTVFAYLLSFLNLRFVMYAVPLVGLVMAAKYRKECLYINIDIKRSLKKIFFLVLIIGIVGQLAVNAPSGFKYKDGIYFYSSHGHDGIWHLSLMEEMHKNIFPFQNPEYTGHNLQNYHFFVDLLMSEISRLFLFNNFDLYFRFFPIIFSLLLGLSSFILVRNWTKSEIAGIWAMIFSFFCGSFGYFLTIPRAHNLSGETIFWVSQTQSSIGNPPHAAAFFIFTIVLVLLLKFLEKPIWQLFLLISFLSGSIIEFKVYAGTLLLGGLLVIAVFELIFKKRIIFILLFLASLVFSAIIYLPNSQNSQEFLVWQPWWFIRTMVVATDRLNWLDLELRRQTYIAEHNIKRVIQLETMAFLIFLFGNLGMRFLGFWTIFTQAKQKIYTNSFNIFFLSITLASFLIPVFFLQKGVAWNTIQFNQYFLLLFGFLAAIATWELLNKIKNKNFKIVVIGLIIFLAIPTQIGLLLQFYTNLPLSKVSYKEIEALDFLKKNSNENSIVLTAPFNKYESIKYQPPVPIYTWYDTGYIPAFSGRSTYFSDEEQIRIMGYEIDNILKERNKIFESPSTEEVNSFLKGHKIDYIYLTKDQNFKVPIDILDLKLIYQNSDARIYQVI